MYDGELSRDQSIPTSLMLYSYYIYELFKLAFSEKDFLIAEFQIQAPIMTSGTKSILGPPHVIHDTLLISYIHWSKQLKGQPVLLLSSFVHNSSINEHKNMKIR